MLLAAKMPLPSSLLSSALCKTGISTHKTRTICFATPSAVMSSQAVHRVIYPYDPHTVTWADRSSPARSYVLGADHPIVSRWEAVSTEIIEMLRNFGMRWAAIECVRRYLPARGLEDRDTSTALIVVPELPNETEALWSLLHNIHLLSGKSVLLDMFSPANSSPHGSPIFFLRPFIPPCFLAISFPSTYSASVLKCCPAKRAKAITNRENE